MGSKVTRIESSPELDTDRQRLTLDGRWQFSYDPHDVGVTEQWFRPQCRLPERITVPGCSQSRFFQSAESKTTKFAGLPELRGGILLRYPCRHSAWYKRSFRVPAGWRGKNTWLHFGGVMPTADLWINGRAIGSTETSRTPVRCNVSDYVTPGQSNCVTIRIHWPKLRLGGLFDGLSAWSGLYRSTWLESVSNIHVRDIRVSTTVSPTTATAEIELERTGRNKRQVRITCRIEDSRGKALVVRETGVSMTTHRYRARIKLPVPGARLWSPDSPCLYRIVVSVHENALPVDQASIRFGFREIRTKGHKVLLNGIPVFLRGGCDDQLYPETVCPPADKRFFLARLKTAKQYGFNYTKSCVEVFTREFLDAADEAGYLVCMEMPFFDRESKQNPSAATRRFWKRELNNIIVSARNHPSVAVYSMTSELNSNWLSDRTAFRFFSRELPEITRSLCGNALVFDATGTSIAPRPGYGKSPVPLRTRYGKRDTDMQGSWLQWNMDGCPLTGPIPGLDDAALPFVMHEFAWITSLSDPSIVDRFKDLPILPLHIPEMIAGAKKNGLAGELAVMFAASRK